MLTELLVIGAGGHSKVLIETVRDIYPSCRVVLADQDNSRCMKRLLDDVEILYMEGWSELPRNFHIAIGRNDVRKKLASEGLSQDKQYFTVIHKAACVSGSARVGDGSFIAALSIVAAESVIGEGCIINHGAVVDHDCDIGAFSHIAPNVTLGGGVYIGDRCMVGAGAVILPQIKVGHNVIIGAGAVVTCDIESNRTVVGIPARCLGSNE